jgi:glycerol-3-phosphate O-acyltransferase/dihydroxyacetone phosphate acyltransferase
MEYGYQALSIYLFCSHRLARFGHPITMDAYKQQFFSSIDGEARAAVKRLTRTIENELVETSINAPDW